MGLNCHYTWVKKRHDRHSDTALLKIDMGDTALLKIDGHGKKDQNVLDKNRHVIFLKINMVAGQKYGYPCIVTHCFYLNSVYNVERCSLNKNETINISSDYN